MNIRHYLSEKKKNFLLKFETRRLFQNDASEFLNNCNLDGRCDNHDRRLSGIIATYHVIEKGLSMPNRRLGFGKAQIKSLISQVTAYFKLYGDDDNQFHHAIEVLKEYYFLHKKENYTLDEDLIESIKDILDIIPAQPSQQEEVTFLSYFKNVHSSFIDFSNSRHSCRWFSGSIDKNTIIKAISEAQNSPSSCNKQPTRVYLVNNKDKAQTILNLQQGNRGFGHAIEQVIVIMSDLNFYSRGVERKSPYIDAGIYTMNLLYTLHYNQIGAIPLVWLSTQERDTKLQAILGAPRNHIPCIVIGVGEVPERLVRVLSPRRNVLDVLKVIE